MPALTKALALSISYMVYEIRHVTCRMYEIQEVAATNLSQRNLTMLNESMFKGMLHVLVLKSQNIIEVCSKVFCLEEFFISKASVI